MKTKNILMIIGTLMVSVSLVQATIWRLDDPIANSDPDFNTISEVLASSDVQAGDTLYLSGTVNSYDYGGGTVAITKKLYIFGPGYFLDENYADDDWPFSATITSSVFFQAGSEGSLIGGVHLVSNVYYHADDITLERCYFSSASYVQYTSKNITLRQNYFYDGLDIGDGSNISILNNIFVRSTISRLITGQNITTNINIANNIFTIQSGASSLYVCNANISNNIFIRTQLMGGTFGNNIFNNVIEYTETNPWPSVNNTIVTTISNIFEGNTDGWSEIEGYTSDGQFRLSGSSPAVGAGYNGVDCGIFGGDEPYVLSGLPAIPRIYYLQVSGTGSALGGLPVEIKVKSGN